MRLQFIANNLKRRWIGAEGLELCPIIRCGSPLSRRYGLRTIRRVVPDRQRCRTSNPAIRSDRYANRAARAGLQTRTADRTVAGLPEAVWIRAAHRDAADD